MVYRAGGNAPLRTHDRHMDLAQRVEPDSDEYPGEYYGVKEGPLIKAGGAAGKATAKKALAVATPGS